MSEPSFGCTDWRTVPRDPRTDPQPGDKLHHPRFGGGTGSEFWVNNRMPNRRHHARAGDELVACTVWHDDGSRLRGGRLYSLKDWPEFMRDATVVLVAP